MAHRHCWTVRRLNKIILTTINAKWIHPSLALRLLKANLGSLEPCCEIIEFALRQPLAEKTEPLLAALAREDDSSQAYGARIPGSVRILGVSVSIWNHATTIELLRELQKNWKHETRPVVVLGGPEVSHLPPGAEIFRYADHVIRGEGETAFRVLCEKILQSKNNPGEIKSAYHLYTDEDVKKKLIYVESSRGCPFKCEFCLSAIDSAVHEFPLEKFLAEMDILIQRGVKTFKFLDRSFNVNIKRALRIIEFFLSKIEQISSSSSASSAPFVVHFEMVPSLFPPELREALARFPPGTLRLEIGIQTLNPGVAARIGRTSSPEKELAALRFLRDKTNAVIHADLIAGLPGEDLDSFGKGFDRLWLALYETETPPEAEHRRVEIQLGILKLLPGAPIRRHNEEFGMRYNSAPPYEVEETSAISAAGIQRVKNFARFWELLVNRNKHAHADSLNPLFNSLRASVSRRDTLSPCDVSSNNSIFEKFMLLSDTLLAHFGRNWGIDRNELREFCKNLDFMKTL